MPLSSKTSMPLGSTLAPQSVAAAGNKVSGYIDARKADRIAAIINLGALGGGTVTVDFLQAKDSTGTGAKALTAGGFAQVTLDEDNATAHLEGLVSALDGAGGFGFVAAKLTVTDGTGALVSAALCQVEPDYKS